MLKEEKAESYLAYQLSLWLAVSSFAGVDKKFTHFVKVTYYF